MTMSDDDILAPRKSRSGSRSRASFSGTEARGPIIDQDGREIRPETLEQGFREFRFEFGQGNPLGGNPLGGNPFGNLTREQRIARLEAIAKLLDVAFILPGTNIRYGIDGLIGLIPVVGDIITTAISLWLVREARALGAPWYLTARMLGNVAVDGVVGMVPLAGDAFDVMFRANMRNMRLLRRWLDKQPRI
ncbi:DUF4112 domain-containing protein [Bradyrhizobium niftali]|jgi:hypothetical protein|uniref:DUF4112 domain-containing protein n=1 Tax=Bradyrhizobium niftali TaxID=2560055 RepID=A0A4Y9LMW4_9BRAD|nr:DUF4112 domain-containing protein [Bradyrhizobium niftali]TFV43997.1 DUF4112 domain-containing protein [Bradyrhizobium niftali]